MVIGCILLAGKAVSKLFSRSKNGGLTSENEKAIVRMETKIEYIITQSIRYSLVPGPTATRKYRTGHWLWALSCQANRCVALYLGSKRGGCCRRLEKTTDEIENEMLQKSRTHAPESAFLG